MSREVRRVAADWQHPKDAVGRYIPLHEAFCYSPAEVAEGLQEGWLHGEPPHYNVGVMPAFDSPTHYMMYETTSEGTPISPAFETPEALAHWLADTGASAFAHMTDTYENWLRVCNGRSSVGMVITSSGDARPGTSL